MFSCMWFIVSGLMYRSLIHFELIFVYGDKQQSSFILLHVAFQFSQHHIEEAFFLHCMFLAPLSKVICLYICGFTSWFSFLFHWSMCLFFCQIMLFWLSSMCSIIWSQGLKTLLCSLFSEYIPINKWDISINKCDTSN